MTKLLPINENPLIRAYPTYSFVESVINNENTTRERLAEFELYGYQDNDWDISIDGLKMTSNSNLINIFVEPYSTGVKAYISRECKDEDEIIIKINHHLPAKPWDSICIYINPVENEVMLEDPNFCYSMGKFPALGFYTCNQSQDNSYHKAEYIKPNPWWMRLSRKQKDILYFISHDGHTWTQLTSGSMEGNKYTEFRIGLRSCVHRIADR